MCGSKVPCPPVLFHHLFIGRKSKCHERKECSFSGHVVVAGVGASVCVCKEREGRRGGRRCLSQRVS